MPSARVSGATAASKSSTRRKGKSSLKLQLIRSATLTLDFAGRRLLIDPDFAPRHARPPLAGRSPNPLVDLPLPPETILAGVEAALVSHLHRDHFDATAQAALPKALPVFCQPGDEAAIRDLGFQRVTPVAEGLAWRGVTITRVAGHHGAGEVEAIMGRVSGFVLAAPGEPTLYWAGDTILCAEVRAAIARFVPAAIVIHACGAAWPDSTGRRAPIVMDAAEAIEVCRLAPTGRVIAVHMDAFDHGTVSRAELRARARAAGVADDHLLIPADGEIIELAGGPSADLAAPAT
jgi:L-ascorbate metabolism protein UlaG (beta-lactamase superfamily)